ncbi:MAG: hypothetical protein ACFFD2_04920 [Promethearchaeota archaeon]
MQNRRIMKRLYDRALKEYRDKRPTEIIGYRIKKSVLLQRGFGPSIILSGLKGQAVPFLMLADYGNQFRLYYILENGIMLNAINIPREQFELERLKFQKATTKLFQIPRPQIHEKKIEKIKKQLNEKFHKYINLIEKRISCKVKTIPIITVYQTPIENKLIIKRERKLINFPLGLISHNLIDGFLLREAYRLALPLFIRKTEHEQLYKLIGVYFLIIKSLKQEWLQFWEPKILLKEKISQYNEKIFFSYLKFLCYLGKYESMAILDPQLEELFSNFSQLSQKIDSIPELAARCYLKIGNQNDLFTIKAVLFFILANQLKEVKSTLKILSKISNSSELYKLKTHCEYIASYQLAKFYSTDLKLDLITFSIGKLFNEAFNHIKAQVLKIERIHEKKGSQSEPITIKIKIKNRSDLTFQNIRFEDQMPKKAQINFINPNSFYFLRIHPNEIITYEYKISCNTPKKINFKNGTLTFEDIYGNHYIQTFTPTHLQVQ